MVRRRELAQRRSCAPGPGQPGQEPDRVLHRPRPAALDRKAQTQRSTTRSRAGRRRQTIATQISQLNGTIKQLVTAGDTPNDLLDRRDSLLDQLSKLGQVSTTDLGNGSIDGPVRRRGDAARQRHGHRGAAETDSRRAPRRQARSAARPLEDRRRDRLLPQRPEHGREDARGPGQRDPQSHAAGTGTNFFTYTARLGGIDGRGQRHRRHDQHLEHGRGRRERRRARRSPTSRGGTADQLYTALRHANRRRRQDSGHRRDDLERPARARSTTAARAPPASRSTRR